MQHSGGELRRMRGGGFARTREQPLREKMYPPIMELLTNCLVEWAAPPMLVSPKVYKVALQKSIPTQIRQLIVYISNNKG